MTKSQTLANVDGTRLERAIASMAEYTVEILSATPEMIDATVTGKNGSYGVVLSPRGNKCTCKDFQFRKVTCKHQTMVEFKRIQQGISLPILQ